VDLNELARKIATNVQQTKLAPRSQALRVALPNAQLTVRGDPMRLEQVLTNLLDNASKYSNSGDIIDFSLALGRGPTGAGEARISVRDRGIGMDANTLPTIFNLFSQADVPLARSRGGLGIGLTLVRTLVELHGGQVNARSEGRGRGSEFEITLPLLAEECHSTSATDTLPQVEKAPAPNSRRVLIVEDNQDAQEALKCLLELWGHDVMVASDGVSGIQSALAHRPEVALVDLGLPTVDGYEVARQIRSALGASAPLMIALTGYGAPEQRAQALAAGFDLHMVNPIDPDRLATLLDEYAARLPTSATTGSHRLPANLSH
jgi:CheY-like chemotaxis protein